MPSASKPSANQGKKDERSNHLIECTGSGVDGNGCVIWTNVCVPTQIPIISSLGLSCVDSVQLRG